MTSRPPPFADPTGAFVEHLGEDGPRRMAVKDMIAVAGCIQGAGLPSRRQYRADTDADVVTRFRRAGYAIVGTTRTDDAGFGTMTPLVKNPVFEARAVGGSSGGSAAAVASGAADVGIGTDTGGSVRIPAAYCGLYAFKSGYGRVPLKGVLPLSPTFDTLGILAATPQTLEHAANVLIGTDRTPDTPPDVADYVLDSEAIAASDDHVRDALIHVAQRLGVGATVRLGVSYARYARAHSIVVCAESFAVHKADWTRDRASFPPVAASVLSYAQTLSEREVTAARAVCADAGAAIRERLGNRILIAPTLPMAPQRRHAQTAVVRGALEHITNANIRLTLCASVAGLPVAVAPLAGLSVQFMGPAGADGAALAAAAAAARQIR